MKREQITLQGGYLLTIEDSRGDFGETPLYISADQMNEDNTYALNFPCVRFTLERDGQSASYVVLDHVFEGKRALLDVANDVIRMLLHRLAEAHADQWSSGSRNRLGRRLAAMLDPSSIDVKGKPVGRG